MTAEPALPFRQIRAVHTDTAITVYQAFSPAIAEPALAAGRFVPPFKRERMTWIKPSMLWMAYRSGWATKPGQERVLAVEITRAGFEWALAHACLSHYEPRTYPDRATWATTKDASPVRIQWDPERDLSLAPLDYRAIQIGLAGEAVDRYVENWIVTITDATRLLRRIRAHLDAGQRDTARALLPDEIPYPVDPPLGARIGATT